MRPRCAVGLLEMVIMFLLDLTDDVWMLPAPSSVSMESVDMRHILRWRPPQASCNTSILYSVQFQGDFELAVLNGSWVDAPECQQVPHTHCDLTFDLGSDSNYNLHVRARCGSEFSAWAGLSSPFNRRNTALTAPEMEVLVLGDSLQVSFDKLPPTAVVRVTVWKRGEELQADVYTLPAEQTVLQVPALLEGGVYCVRAQAVFGTELQSGSTDAHCVSITGAYAAWKRPTTVTVTVVIVAGLLFAVSCSIVHCRSDACHTYFRKEPLPDSLLPGRDIQILIGFQLPELSEQLDMVQSIDSEQQASKTDAAARSYPGDQSSGRPFTIDFVE